MANIRKRGNTYQIRVSCGYNSKGEQVVHTMSWKIPAGMTKKQAEREAHKQAVIFEDKCFKGYMNTTMKFQYFAEQWFKEHAEINLRKTSYQRMRQVTKRVYPAIGQVRMDKISARQIQQFINGLVQKPRNDHDEKPLARKTAVHHLSFISDVFSYAVRMELIDDNPCRKVYVPKSENKEKEIYTVDEIRKLFSLIDGEPLKYRMFFVLAIYSGFRRGELMGLEWKDVDFEHNIFRVRRTSNYVSGVGLYTDTTKTKSSQRSMKFPQSVMDMLKEYKAAQDEQAKAMGSKWVDSDRLFTKDTGEPMFNGMPYKWLKALCEKNGLPFHGLHSIRHFYASSLISEGVDVATVSSALGHSAISTTTNIYLHAFQDANAKASDAIAEVLSFTAPKPKRHDPDGRAKLITVSKAI